MPHLIALKKFRYAGQKLRPGDNFKVKGSHVDILVRANLAREITQPAYQTRHMEAVKQDWTGTGTYVPTAKTVPELRAEAEARGIQLPKGYVPKSELIRLLG